VALWETSPNHIVQPLKGIWRAAGKLAPWVAAGITATEVKEIWKGQGSKQAKVLKSITAVGLDLAAYLSSATVVGVLAESGPGIVAGVSITIGIGYISDSIKQRIYNIIK
jgi:hypothetical protein